MKSFNPNDALLLAFVTLMVFALIFTGNCGDKDYLGMILECDCGDADVR